MKLLCGTVSPSAVHYPCPRLLFTSVSDIWLISVATFLLALPRIRTKFYRLTSACALYFVTLLFPDLLCFSAPVFGAIGGLRDM